MSHHRALVLLSQGKKTPKTGMIPLHTETTGKLQGPGGFSYILPPGPCQKLSSCSICMGKQYYESLTAALALQFAGETLQRVRPSDAHTGYFEQAVAGVDVAPLGRHRAPVAG